MTAKSGHPARERSRVRATGTRSSGHLALSPAGCEGRPPRVTEGGSAARRSHDREGRGARLERGGLELCPCDDKEGPVWFTPAGHPGVVHRSSPATGGCEHSSVAAWSERTGAVGGCVVTDEAGDELADAQTWFSSRTLSAAPSHNWDREPVVTPSGGRSPLIPPVRGQASRLRACGVNGKAVGSGGRGACPTTRTTTAAAFRCRVMRRWSASGRSVLGSQRSFTSRPLGAAARRRRREPVPASVSAWRPSRARIGPTRPNRAAESRCTGRNGPGRVESAGVPARSAAMAAGGVEE